MKRDGATSGPVITKGYFWPSFVPQGLCSKTIISHIQVPPPHHVLAEQQSEGRVNDVYLVLWLVNKVLTE